MREGSVREAARLQSMIQGQTQNTFSRHTCASQLVASVREVSILESVPEWQGKVPVGAARKYETRIVVPRSYVPQWHPQSYEVVGVQRSHAQV
jgi:hypothetical protein